MWPYPTNPSVWSEKLLSTFIFSAYHDNSKYEEHTIIWIKDALPFTFKEAICIDSDLLTIKKMARCIAFLC